MSDSNTRYGRSDSREVSNKEVSKLFGKDKSDHEILSELKQKYGNEGAVEKVFDAYKERQTMIFRKARKFKQLILARYSRYNLTSPQLLKKARKYQKKYDLSDDEFNVFLRIALTDKHVIGASSTMLPNTAMSKTLGYATTVTSQERLKVKPDEMDTLQDILRLHGETRSLHSKVVLQSLTYRDCAPEAITGEYRHNVSDVYSYVHPVVAALFLPRVELLDEHMLIANLSGIIKTKHEGKPILTKPDYQVYWNLITDPNDTVCDMSSPLKDLHHRCQLQARLWDSVLKLRQGQYYGDALSEFLVAVDSCRNNIYDAPDLTYVKDEGTVLRRLLAAFSLRPTVVSTTPMYGVASNNPHLSAAAITQLTNVPMINLRLPINVQGNSVALHLDNARQQAQWFVENKMLVPKNQSIMYSWGVLFFYVGRRYQTINLSRVSAPYNFNSLPMTVNGFEAINDIIVNFDKELTISDDLYQLRSVVIVEKADVPNGTDNSQRFKLVTGCTAAIVVPRDIQAGVYDESVLLYDPQGAGEQFQSGGNYTRNAPITYIPVEDQFNGGDVDSFYKRASTRGTCFMYVKKQEGNNPFFRRM